MPENKKKLPIGIDSFDKIRRGDFYYIDKTGLILDLLRNWGGSKSLYPPPEVRKITEYEYAESFF